ncbi:MAG TPA: hypothetical protein VN924_22900 [Bryobacteraceae bacterium]|nr:hypothetical protein [Bryobacteraceae bacterium]
MAVTAGSRPEHKQTRHAERPKFRLVAAQRGNDMIAVHGYRSSMCFRRADDFFHPAQPGARSVLEIVEAWVHFLKPDVHVLPEVGDPGVTVRALALMAETCQRLVRMPIKTTRVGMPTARNNCMSFIASFCRFILPNDPAI